jgi:hypothetical protein
MDRLHHEMVIALWGIQIHQHRERAVLHHRSMLVRLQADATKDRASADFDVEPEELAGSKKMGLAQRKEVQGRLLELHAAS